MKDKFKYLPVNLFTTITSFFLPFIVITYFFPNCDIWVKVGISIYVYLIDAINESKIDYLEDKINKLEEKQKVLEDRYNNSK